MDLPAQYLAHTTSRSLSIRDALGSGAQGSVYRVCDDGDDVFYAMKVMTCKNELEVWRNLFEVTCVGFSAWYGVNSSFFRVKS